MANVNMAISARFDGNQDDILRAGLSGLITGGVMGYFSYLSEPANIGEYLLRRNVANNLDALIGDDDFKLSAGLISFNLNKASFSTIFDKNMSLYERLGMAYETAGMMKYLPKTQWLKKSYMKRSILGNRNRLLGGKPVFLDFRGIKSGANYFYNILDGIYNENQIIATYLTQKSNQPTINKGLDALNEYLKENPLNFSLPW
ncbi:MAG TPA: hypothetical protein VIO15_06185 [Bacteroidales bacterium]